MVHLPRLFLYYDKPFWDSLELSDSTTLFFSKWRNRLSAPFPHRDDKKEHEALPRSLNEVGYLRFFPIKPIFSKKIPHVKLRILPAISWKKYILEILVPLVVLQKVKRRFILKKGFFAETAITQQCKFFVESVCPVLILSFDIITQYLAPRAPTVLYHYKLCQEKELTCRNL